MELINKIVDLPVIIQGALGSFLFWLAYELTKRFFDLVLEFGTRINHEWRMEYLLSQQSHVIQELLEGEEARRARTGIKVLAIQVAINRSIHGAIYVILGLISEPFIGSLSNLAFLVSLAYFYRALKASHIDIESKQSKDWYKARLAELEKEIEQLKNKKSLAKS
ncbi:hypothetical protein [Vibrio sp. 99K-1]|uniref:hypothetical protein n=1 Tax=Vibrio sp. 99K-1 TaxID=2607603 RepID=UPI0014937428|nr:hypothetical protein [Vibrio sp. 99K-1]NOI85012.1 hypothetical protein [Vibrio sp. 99K-1]